MPHIFRNKQLMTVILITVVILALIALTSNDDGEVTIVESYVARFVTSVQGILFEAGSRVRDYVGEIKEIGSLRQESILLRELIDEYERESIDIESLEKQNERLKALLDFKTQNQDLIVIGANVIGKNPGNWFNIFAIDKGSAHGVEKNMAVVTDKGLAGRVIEVGDNYAKVLSIIDGRSSISGIIDRTRDNGVVRGNNMVGMEDGLCTIQFLPVDSEILVGDTVLTSGLGGFIPKGIVIGEIINIQRESHELLKHAVIQPAVDFYRLEEVLVVKSRVQPIEDIE